MLPGRKTKLFILNLGGIYIMKNTISKNLIKSMAQYGEMLKVLGVL